MMRHVSPIRAVLILAVFAAAPHHAGAQQAATTVALDDTQLTGMRLFNQSCRVCHTKPQMTSPNYGPELSKDSLGGKDDVLREVIANGTPRMPGFKYHFDRAQIDAIVAYLKTIPARQAATSSTGAGRNNSRDAD